VDAKYQKLQKVQQGSLALRRIRRYTTLYGVGFFFWMTHLWQLLMLRLKYIDETTSHWLWRWTIGLFQDEPTTKIYPIVYAIDILGLIVFLASVVYVTYWIYADCYCKSVETQKTVSFSKQLAIAVVVNIATYCVLRFILMPLLGL
jgi:hypothetical protein